MQPDDRITVIGFSRTPSLLADSISGDDAAQLPDIINQSSSEGGTNIEQALKLAETSPSATRSMVHRIASSSSPTAPQTSATPIPNSLAERVKELRQQDLAFDIAGIGTNDINDRLLSELSRHGNGRYYLVGENTAGNLAKSSPEPSAPLRRTSKSRSNSTRSASATTSSSASRKIASRPRISATTRSMPPSSPPTNPAPPSTRLSPSRMAPARSASSTSASATPPPARWSSAAGPFPTSPKHPPSTAPGRRCSSPPCPCSPPRNSSPAPSPMHQLPRPRTYDSRSETGLRPQPAGTANDHPHQRPQIIYKPFTQPAPHPPQYGAWVCNPLPSFPTPSPALSSTDHNGSVADIDGL